MFVFIHLHKCAGTSVVDAVAATGLRLPDKHANGNPYDGGIIVDYFSKMTPAQFMQFMKRMKREGVEFFAMEWDMPQLQIVRQAHEELGANFFTILRDPLDRAISNMRMDAGFGWGTPFTDLDSYFDSSATYRSANYYTKFLSGNAYKQEATLSDLTNALGVMGTLIKYSFVGENLLQFLNGEVRLPIAALGNANAFKDKKNVADVRGRVRLEPSPEEHVNFRLRNVLDYTLYDILRRRLASPGTEASASPGTEASASPGTEASASPGPDASVSPGTEASLPVEQLPQSEAHLLKKLA
jgi:hypothetical protein